MPEKAYVVIQGNLDRSILGVFTDIEKANAFCARENKSHAYTIDNDCFVESYVLNPEPRLKAKYYLVSAFRNFCNDTICPEDVFVEESDTEEPFSIDTGTNRQGFLVIDYFCGTIEVKDDESKLELSRRAIDAAYRVFEEQQKGDKNHHG